MICAYNYPGGRDTPRSSWWFVPPGFSSRPGFYFRSEREKVRLPVALTCVVQKCGNVVMKYNRKWLEIRKLPENPTRDLSIVPRVFSLENEKTLGLRERSRFQTSCWPQILKWPPKRIHEVSYSELPVLFSLLRDLRNWGRLEVEW